MSAYGSIATIGFIGPPRTNSTVLHEAFRLAPEGVTWTWSTMGLPEFGQFEFDQALSLAEVCAKELAARDVSVIVMAGIPLITSKGVPYHQQLEAELASAIGHKVPVVSDIGCVMAALAALKIKRMSLASIYQRFIQDNVIRYMGGYGFDILHDEGLEYALADCMRLPTMTTSLDAGRRALAGAPDADGLFIACPQWPVIGNIEPLERESGKPVVTHLTAAYWGGLCKAGVRAPVQGYGSLLDTWPDWVDVSLAAK